MHEHPITRDILKIALETARQEGADHIQAINLVVGELTSIVEESIQLHFDALSQNTIADGARLNIRREAATMTCLACGHHFEINAVFPELCPHCDSLRLNISSGLNFYVESIEVKKP